MYVIEPIVNSTWFKIIINLDFYAQVISEEEARRVVWIEINKKLTNQHEYLTDKHFTYVFEAEPRTLWIGEQAEIKKVSNTEYILEVKIDDELIITIHTDFLDAYEKYKRGIIGKCV
jgi:hypothetical protein